MVKGALFQDIIKNQKDFILVLQHRTSIVVQTLLGRANSVSIKEGIFKIPMIFYSVNSRLNQDCIFYIKNDSRDSSIDIQKLSLHEKNSSLVNIQTIGENI